MMRPPRRLGPAALAALAALGSLSACASASSSKSVSGNTAADSPMAGGFEHLVPTPMAAGTQIVDGNEPPGVSNAPPRYARLYRSTAGGTLYVDSETTQPSDWVHPEAEPAETIVSLAHGPGILTSDSPSADQVLYNRIGTVLNNRVPEPRQSGSVLLWTDGTLDYYAVALNAPHSAALLEQVAGSIRATGDAAFQIGNVPGGFNLIYNGEMYSQWAASPPPVVYGFANEQIGEVDVTLVAATAGFLEAFLGKGGTTIRGHLGWSLQSQPVSGRAERTLVWYENPGELAVASSDGRASADQLAAFVTTLHPVTNSTWQQMVAGHSG